MSMVFPTYYSKSIRLANNVLVTMLFMYIFSSILFAQTSPNTIIRNQAKAAFQFKTLPADTTRSNIVAFSVLDAPNFEMSISNTDTLTFGKDTVTFRIVYTNIGNRTADSASIEGMLPPVGFRFIPGTTGGTIQGNAVTWKVKNIPSGRTDSVSVKAIVDSGLVLNTQLVLEANLGWQSTQITASKTFIIASYPKLSLNIVPERSMVGSGRSVTYRIIVNNTGNSPSLNTIVYDTISVNGSMISSGTAPDSSAANKRLLKWNLGSVPAFTSKEISLSVGVMPNLGHDVLRNSAITYSANVPAVEQASSTIPILPVVPKSISIVPDPQFIFGQANKDSSRISVILKDSINDVMPEGTTVRFTASIGTFSNGAAIVSTTIRNGSAVAILRSVNVDNDIVSSKITVTGGTPGLGTIQDTASVHFYPGAVTGIVVNGVNRVPFTGAIARVFNSRNSVVGADTTKSDGKFFIALNKDVAKYILEILVIDKFGDSIKTTSDVDPTRFPLPPVVIPNIISGRIEYQVTGQPVAAQNVTVFLDSLAPALSVKQGRRSSARTSPKQGSLVRVLESITDANGKFKFENLRPARYVISLDSAEFPNFNGYTFLTDTAAGTFTINLSLQITLDSSVTVTAAAPPAADAGDTITVGVRIINTGTAAHKNVVLSDTLSPFVKFISATKGKFLSVGYDSSGRVVRWMRDTLQPLLADSVLLKLFVSENIPNRTVISNRFWFTSNVNTVQTGTATTVSSNGIVVFANRFIVPKDTIIAGDSILHIFKFRNIGTDSLRHIRIVDTLFSAGSIGIAMMKQAAHDSLQIVDSISTIYVGSIAPGAEDSVSLKLITDFALSRGTTVASHAYMLTGDSIIAQQDTLFTVAENPSLPSFISIIKTANKKVAEIGDIITYQLTVTNASPQPLRSISVYDLLPYAFQYVKNSARFNGHAVEPVANAALNQMTWNVPDTIPAGKSASMVYQLAIGADALESEGMNTAYAGAITGSGAQLISAPSQWQVTVRPGVFTEKGLIIGKVFYDDNRNTFQDPGENGVKGIELWMEDGTKIITGNDGKFSLPEVKPGQHVMRVNELTLPKNSTLLPGNNAFAKDAVSRFVRVTESGIAKANFYLKRSVSDSIVQAVSKVNRLMAVRQAKPKYLFEDTLRQIRVDTVTMYVSFNYSGNMPVASMMVTDRLDERLTMVPGSAVFNGQRINPVYDSNSVRWKLGSAERMTRGVLRYQAVVNKMPKQRTVLTSVSTVTVVSVDSQTAESNILRTENSIIDTVKNRIETSDVASVAADPRNTAVLSDSIQITSGDEVFFKTSIYLDPVKKIKEAFFIDTIPSSFIINERTFSVNGVPVPSRNLSVRIRSMAISSVRPRPENLELEFFRISSLELTNLLKSGMNEITYSARFQSTKKDTLIRKHSYAIVVDEFNESRILHSRDARIYIRSFDAAVPLQLETTYVDILRPAVKVEEKIADAVKLVESLRQGSSNAIVMEGITFELSKATLTSDSKIVLDNIAKILLENTDIRIQINGYTDNTGNASANRKMSLNRAKEVASYLIAKGISPDRLLPQGFGPAKPIASNKTEEGRSKNRRVEFAPMQ
jgi:uncharacterized repeat protein (TIGR01451 family)